MEEQWKPIQHYEAFYEISDKGRVRSLRTGIIMKTRLGRDGYVRVPLTKEGKQKHEFLHRLLAIVFIPNPENLPEVNHINENKQDNSLSNLEWCTHKYNSNYGTRLKRMAISNYEPVIQYTKDGREIARYASQKEAMEKTGIQCRHISCCCKGKRKTVGGYVWRYAKAAILGLNTPNIAPFLPQK